MKLRLSHSTLDILHTCERKFELDRLIEGEKIIEESVYFSRGHSYGTGIQWYLATQNIELAIFKAWLAYWPELEQKPKVFQARTLQDLLNIQRELDEFLEEWEVATFNGKPAIELSFRLDINENFYYVGYIDVVVKKRNEELYGVVEVKRTSTNLTDVRPLYKFSGQGLGYSIVLDKIANKQQSNYSLIYAVGQDIKNSLQSKFHLIDFKKTLQDRLHWFISLGLDVKHITEMLELGIFPRRYTSCVRFNKVCTHFSTCNLTAGEKYKEDNPEDEEKEYQFTYDLQELINDHIERAKDVGA